AVVPAGLVLGERGLRVVEPQPFRGTAPFLLDPVEVLQPNAMDLLGRKRERGPGPDLGRVHLLAPVEGPEPDGLRGVGPVVAKDAEEAFVGGHDPVRDHRHEPVVFLLPDVAERRDGRGVVLVETSSEERPMPARSAMAPRWTASRRARPASLGSGRRSSYRSSPTSVPRIGSSLSRSSQYRSISLRASSWLSVM